MENVDNLPEVIVEIYDLITPELGYFVFFASQKEKLNLNVKPFILKESDKICQDEYHIKDDDILYFQNFSSNIILYNRRFKDHTWEESMRWEIYTIIERGLLNRKAKNAGKEVFVKFLWTGKKLVKSTIEYKW